MLCDSIVLYWYLRLNSAFCFDYFLSMYYVLDPSHAISIVLEIVVLEYKNLNGKQIIKLNFWIRQIKNTYN